MRFWCFERETSKAYSERRKKISGERKQETREILVDHRTGI